MHGLASHGVQGTDMVPGTVMASASMTAPPANPDSVAVGVHGLAVATSTHADSLQGSGSGHGGMDMSIAMMCIAVLGAALLALLRFLRHERPWSVLWTRPNLTRAMAPPGLGPAPPSLTELSIQRC